jgi:MerR family copper efflux transcriptional regulator
MLIKEFATRAGLTPDAIRFYERKGLLHPARGKSNRYRRYGDEDLEIVQQIKIGQALGFTLAEIKRGAEAWRQGSLTVDVQIGMVEAKVGEVSAKLKQLHRIKQYLRRKLVWMKGDRTAAPPEWCG